MTSPEHELITQLTKCLSWYVENDDTNDWEENEYWLKGKKEAENMIKKANTFIDDELIRSLFKTLLE